jgi:hypothetical protein
MTTLSRYPEIIDLAANNLAPQHLVHYLRDLANDFHTYYNAHVFIVARGYAAGYCQRPDYPRRIHARLDVMAKKRSKRRRSSSQKQDYPGWVWMLFGLAIGLSVAFAIYVRGGKPAAPQPVTRQPASLESAIDDNGEASPAGTAEQGPTESRFTFYDMLPNFEVVIPEQEPDVKPARHRVEHPARHDRRQDLPSCAHRPDGRPRKAECAAQPASRREDRRHPHSFR